MDSNGNGTKEKALSTTVQPSVLDLYAPSHDMTEIAKQFMAILPGGNNLTLENARSLAILSRAYNLNPANGEVWYIVKVDKQTHALTPVGPMVGIKGLRKIARKQAPYLLDFEPLTAEEKADIGWKQGDVAKKALVWRMDFAQYGQANHPFIGYGIVKSDEYTKMNRLQCAMKRAEADGLKRAYDLPVATEGDTAIDADFQVIGVEDDDDEREGDATLAQRKANQKAGALMNAQRQQDEADLVEPEPQPALMKPEDFKNLPRPWAPHEVNGYLLALAQWAEEKKAYPNDGLLGAALGIMDKAGDRPPFLREMFNVSSATELTPWQKRALSGWVKPEKDPNTNEWIPQPHFHQEYVQVIEARLVEEGQDPLFGEIETEAAV